MRILLMFFILVCSLILQGQTQKLNGSDSTYPVPHFQARKWFLSSYSGVGVGFNFFKGNEATTLTVPMGLQLNHRLNDNFYAFANILAAPSYINFNRSFLSPGVTKANAGGGLSSGYLGLTSSVNLGLMYVNDARTFSVSGSIGVARASYPMLFYPPANIQKVKAQN